MSQAFQKAVILLALGTPSDLTLSSVRKFLRAYLDDAHVLAIPKILRKLLLAGIILPFRAKKSLAMYEKIWLPQGSPLSVHTESLRKKLQSRLGEEVLVLSVMRGGEPSAEDALRKIAELGIKEIVVIPQFPQESESAREAATEYFLSAARKILPNVPMKFVPPFFDSRGYIEAVVEKFPERTAGQKFVFSFHSVPVRSISRVAKRSCGAKAFRGVNCDPSSRDFSETLCADCVGREKCYRRQCYACAARIAEFAGIPREDFYVSFQSRFGEGQWLIPETNEVLRSALDKGKVVFCAPGFTADCIETLLLKNEFDAVTVVPCVNDSEKFADFLAECATSS